MGFGRDPFKGMRESDHLYSTLRMCNDFLDLVKSAEKREKERDDGIKSVMDKWLELVITKLITILEEMKTHLWTWVSTKVGSIADELSLYVNEYFDSKIRLLEERAWFNNSEEHEILLHNLKEVRKNAASTEDDMKLTITEWQESIKNRIIEFFKDCENDIYNQVKTKISIREAHYIDEFFSLSIKYFKEGKSAIV